MTTILFKRSNINLPISLPYGSPAINVNNGRSMLFIGNESDQPVLINNIPIAILYNNQQMSIAGTPDDRETFINFNAPTISVDYYSAYNGGSLTTPFNGIYEVNVKIGIRAISIASASFLRLSVYKDGVLYKELDSINLAISSAIQNISMRGTCKVSDCVGGVTALSIGTVFFGDGVVNLTQFPAQNYLEVGLIG